MDITRTWDPTSQAALDLGAMLNEFDHYSLVLNINSAKAEGRSNVEFNTGFGPVCLDQRGQTTTPSDNVYIYGKHWTPQDTSNANDLSVAACSIDDANFTDVSLSALNQGHVAGAKAYLLELRFLTDAVGTMTILHKDHASAAVANEVVIRDNPSTGDATYGPSSGHHPLALGPNSSRALAVSTWYTGYFLCRSRHLQVRVGSNALGTWAAGSAPMTARIIKFFT